MYRVLIPAENFIVDADDPKWAQDAMLISSVAADTAERFWQSWTNGNYRNFSAQTIWGDRPFEFTLTKRSAMWAKLRWEGVVVEPKDQ